MKLDYIKYRENQNLLSIVVSNKDEYYMDLRNIENSFTGRMDAQITNKFIYESVQLVINAIVLFEKGYFDCSFYSLRQALELSTTMIYLIELDEQQREEELSNWKTQSDFPMFGQMMIFLNNNNYVFSEMLEKMSNYFSKLKIVKEKLNKYVHKQGFNTFYISRNSVLNNEEDIVQLKNDFNKYIKICIGAIAVLRLAIDPFPILLMDKEIYSRTGDTLTLAYSEEFIEKYIGNEYIENYKKTQMYINHYEDIMKEEEKLPCVVDVVETQYIDKNKINIILSQKHLLSKTNIIAVLIADFSEKVAKIHCHNGLLSYFTSTKTVRKSFKFSSRDLQKVKKSNSYINRKYDEAYLTYIKIYEEDYFIEHNEKFSHNEIQELMKVMQHFT
jgi:hypothetical protein